MKYMTKTSIMKRLTEHYEIAKEADEEVFGIFLQGSQNYIDELFFEGSDVDSKAVYLPSTSDICLGIDISRPTKVLENTEHIDQFDIRSFLKLITRPNVNTYELLFTEYFIINPKYEDLYNEILKLRERVVRIDEKRFVMSTMGISHADFKILEKIKGGEDYDINTFGYSRKRLSNIMRFNSTIKAYIAGKGFSDCLKSLDENTIYEVRRTELYTLKEAREIADELNTETYELAYAFNSEVDYSVLDELNKVFVEIMVRSMKLDK